MVLNKIKYLSVDSLFQNTGYYTKMSLFHAYVVSRDVKRILFQPMRTHDLQSPTNNIARKFINTGGLASAVKLALP